MSGHRVGFGRGCCGAWIVRMVTISHTTTISEGVPMDEATTQHVITLLAELGIRRTEITAPMLVAIHSFVDELTGSTAICVTCKGTGRVRAETASAKCI